MLWLGLLMLRLYPTPHLWLNLPVQNLVSQSFINLYIVSFYSNGTFPHVEAGIPYSLTVFAVNTAGSGERTTITNFTRELSMFYDQLNIMV